MNVDPPTHTEASNGADQAPSDLQLKGDLPFVGRKAELDYLHAFVRGALAADRLSALWIQGEAGIGKSRLINQIAEDFYPATTLIRCRFYPDANLSIQSVLASAVLDAARHHGISTSLTLPLHASDNTGGDSGNHPSIPNDSRLRRRPPDRRGDSERVCFHHPWAGT